MATLIVADESVDMPIVRDLRQAGWDVWSVLEECPASSDEAVLEIARSRNAILLTMDSDFGDLAFERGALLPNGVVFVRNKKLSIARATQLILKVLMADEASGKFVTLSRSSKRVRALPKQKET